MYDVGKIITGAVRVREDDGASEAFVFLLLHCVACKTFITLLASNCSF